MPFTNRTCSPWACGNARRPPQGAARIQAAGANGMLADAGPTASGLLDATIQRGGAGATTARNAIEARAGQAGQDIQSALDTSLGAPRGVEASIEATRRATASARSTAYRDAYAQPIDYAHPVGQEVEGLLSRLPGEAIGEAVLRRLEAEWPYWAFFFNQVDDSIKLLLSCVAGSRYLGRGAVEMDADLVAAAMARAFGGMNAVFERFNFPEDELELMSRGFVEVLQQAGVPVAVTVNEPAAPAHSLSASCSSTVRSASATIERTLRSGSAERSFGTGPSAPFAVMSALSPSNSVPSMRNAALPAV